MAKKTITSIFILPTLLIKKEILREHGIINAYVADVNKDSYGDDYIYLLFKPPDQDKFNIFVESEYERTEQLIEDYDYSEGFSVLVYKLDPKWEKDYKLIREGKYSKTSKEFQGIFQKVIKIVIDGLHQDQISLQYRIFKKTTDLIELWERELGVTFSQEQEAWSGFFIEKETLNIEKIKTRLKEIGINN